MRKFFLLIAMLVLVAVAITGAAAAPKILIYARGADSRGLDPEIGRAHV